MIRAIFSLGSILVIAAVVAGGTAAFFSDSESSTGNTFAAGAIDLLIDNESYYNGEFNGGTSWELKDLGDEEFFFNFLDLKPGDEGEDTISLHVDDNDAWACMDITVTSTDENGCNEPESLVDNSCDDPGQGELQNEINFVWWADDGDNVLEDDEIDSIFSETSLANLTQSIVLADSSGDGILSEGPLASSEDYYIGKAWCFGELEIDAVAQDGNGNEENNGPIQRGSGIQCDGSDLGNETQTDSVTADISFTATQSRNDTAFFCSALTECEIEETYADEVVSSDQGLRKNGNPVAGDRSDPTLALGAPQSSGTEYDNPVIPNSFFSLGFPFEEDDAEIVLEFNNNLIVDGPGDDLKLWEVTGGSDYPDEQVDVYVGNASNGPWTLVGNEVTRDAEIDINPIASARYVRIVDASDVSLFEDTADGYDLDAVQALNCVVRDDVEEDLQVF